MNELQFDVLGNLQLAKKKIEAQIIQCYNEPVETCQKCGEKLKGPVLRAFAYCRKCSCPMGFDMDCEHCRNGSKVLLGDGSVDDVFCMISERSQEANYQADNDRCDWCGGTLDQIENDSEYGPTLRRYEIVSANGWGEEYEIGERHEHFCNKCHHRFISPTTLKTRHEQEKRKSDSVRLHECPDKRFLLSLNNSEIQKSPHGGYKIGFNHLTYCPYCGGKIE